MKYYRLIDNINYPKRWYLGDIVEEDDNWIFTYGKCINQEELTGNLQVEIYMEGDSMDYTNTEAYSVPIVSERLMQALCLIEELQFISVVVKGAKFYIMVICKLLDCVNESESVFDKYEISDPIRPDKVGDYKSFYKLKIDESKVNGNKIFRLSKYDIVIIVDESTKVIFDTIHATGSKFLLL